MFVSYKCYTNLHIIVCKALLLIGSILNNQIHIIVNVVNIDIFQFDLRDIKIFFFCVCYFNLSKILLFTIFKF